jgi:hypothetical protein
MSNAFHLASTIEQALDPDQEIVTVTSKQYAAVAEDVLRRLFPEEGHSSLADCDQPAFTVFVKDDEYLMRRYRLHQA